MSAIREQLIHKVPAGDGRKEYARMMNLLPDTIRCIEGHLGEEFYIRVIKGMQRLHIKSALLTNEGMATEDGQVMDCGAALVTMESGSLGENQYDAERFSGKNNGAVQRIRTSYDPATQKFGLGTDDIPEQMFPASLLHPRTGAVIRAKMGGDILEGVLCDDALLVHHIRACLAGHVQDPSTIALLLRSPTFFRLSDTALSHQRAIRTLMSDGSQLHVQNRATMIHESAAMERDLPEAVNRHNMLIEGIEIQPFEEDVIGRIVIRAENANPIVEFADLTPRCSVPDLHPETGEASKGSPVMKHRLKTRPHVAVGPKGILKPTAGANAHLDPLSVGKEGVVIHGGDGFMILNEKTELRR